METSEAEDLGTAIGQAPSAVSRPRGIDWWLMLRRMGRVTRLDHAVYPDLAQDPAALRQAAWVIRIVTVAAAIGTVLVAGWEAGALLGAVLGALLHWLIWTGVTYLIASRLFHTSASLRGLLATMGYAQAPHAIAILAFIPFAGPALVVLSRLLMFVAGHQAMEQTADLGSRRNAATAILAFVIGLAVSALVEAWLGDIGAWEALLRP